MSIPAGASAPESIAAGPGDVSDAVIELSDVYPTTARELWQAWTKEERMRQWLTEASIECSLGGRFELYFMPEGQERGSEGCRVLSFVPERMLSFTWNSPPSFPQERPRHTFVVLFFTPVEGGTRLELNHLGWPASGMAGGAGKWREVFAYFEAAWPEVLGALHGAFSSAEA